MWHPPEFVAFPFPIVTLHSLWKPAVLLHPWLELSFLLCMHPRLSFSRNATSCNYATLDCLNWLTHPSLDCIDLLLINFYFLQLTLQLQLNYLTIQQAIALFDSIEEDPWIEVKVKRMVSYSGVGQACSQDLPSS